MSPQQRGGGSGDVARGAGYAALLGALLIAVAVVIGIVLLQIGDNNDNGPARTAGKKTTTTKKHTTTTKKANSNPTASTTPTARKPSEVRVIVLNGGAAAGKAGDMTDALRLKGYTNIGKANDWTGHGQTGNLVTCRANFEREGTALAIQVGAGTKTAFPYPTPPPPFSSDYDCVVVVGAAG
jgi:LytR cell envelope-related transcriptional attenuator